MRKGILLTPVLVAGLMMLTSCPGNNTNEELRAQEQKLLEEYLENNGITQVPTPSGLYYIPIVEGTGEMPAEDDWVEIEYVGELVDGSLFATSYDSVATLHNLFDEDYLYGPARTRVTSSMLSGLFEGLQYMRAQGRSRLIIPSELAYGSGSTALIPQFSTLIFTIDLLTVFSDPAEHERELIQQFLADSNFTADSTASGLYYIEQVEGTGDLIKDGDHLDVWYTGFFLDGRVFDSNINGSKFPMIVGLTSVVDGWDEGLALMREGSKGILIVPYYLGYGEQGLWDQYGRTPIPPYMTLVFDIAIDDVY